MQSHGGQVRQSAEFRHGCEHYGETPESGRFARRAALRAAVLGHNAVGDGTATDAGGSTSGGGTPDGAARPSLDGSQGSPVVVGQVSDVSPHVLILETTRG